MGINQRIREIRRKLCDDSNVDFARRMGERPQTTSGWQHNSKDVGMRVILKIHAGFPEISLDWLIAGRGEMEITRKEQNHTANNLDSNGSECNPEIERLHEIIKRLMEQIDRLIDKIK